MKKYYIYDEQLLEVRDAQTSFASYKEAVEYMGNIILVHFLPDSDEETYYRPNGQLNQTYLNFKHNQPTFETYKKLMKDWGYSIKTV